MNFTSTHKKYGLFSPGFFTWTERIAYVLLCLCILDCSLTGAGRYYEIGPLTPRMIVGFLALFCLLPNILCNLRKLLKNPIFILFLVFLGYFAVCAVRGYLANHLREVWLSDVKGFLWLFLVPVAVLTVNNPSRLKTVLNCVIVGALGQAILVIVSTHICSIPHGISRLYFPFLDLGIGSVFSMTSNITRIFTRSCPYMVFACSIALFWQIHNKRINWLYMITAILCLCASLLSFTRSLFGCIFVVAGLSVVICLIFYRKHWRRLIACVLIMVVGFGVCIFTMEQIYDARFTAFAVSRTLGIPFIEKLPPATEPTTESTAPDATETTPPETKPSTPPETKPKPPVDQEWERYEQANKSGTEIRDTTVAELVTLIKQNPIFGNGLGASAPSRNGPDEYFYHDILARMGILGLLLYLAPFAYVLIFCFRKKKTLVTLPLAFSVICGMVGFWAITFFNPWMNAALGIAMYALYCSLPGVLEAKEIALTAETVTDG